MTNDRKVAFTKANYIALDKISKNLGLDPIHIDWSIKTAQELYEKGIHPSDVKLEPKETFILREIMKAVTSENFPSLLIVYLNDRYESNLSESDFSTVLERNTWAAQRELFECVDGLVEKHKLKPNVEHA